MLQPAKYTPGPWAHDDGHVFTEDRSRVHTSIAHLYEIEDNLGLPESNAHLIVAAPDLFTALRAIKARLDGEYDHPALVAYGSLTSTVGDIARIVEEALQKADIVE